MLRIAPEPILDFTNLVSDAVRVASARGTLSVMVPSKQSANCYAEHLGDPRSICPALFKVRPMPSAHLRLLLNNFDPSRMSTFRNNAIQEAAAGCPRETPDPAVQIRSDVERCFGPIRERHHSSKSRISYMGKRPASRYRGPPPNTASFARVLGLQGRFHSRRT